jgi:hypothetical membrane protein
MTERNLKIAGILAFVGAAQWILFVILAESYYPNYNVSQNFLSDLGATCPIGGGACTINYPSSTIWNATLALMGLFAVSSAYLFRLEVKKRTFTIFFGLWGLGSLLAGIFPETYLGIHELSSYIAFVSGAIAAILAFRFIRSPFRYVSLALGILVLAWLFPVLFSGPFTRAFGGKLGAGFVERMAVYPIVIWQIGLGAQLMNGIGAIRDFIRPVTTL